MPAPPTSPTPTPTSFWSTTHISADDELLLAADSDNDNDNDNNNNSIEYELIDYLLLGDIEEAYSSSVASPRMERYRTASFLEHIDSDLLDETTAGAMAIMAHDESFDDLFEIRHSWMSSLVGGQEMREEDQEMERDDEGREDQEDQERRRRRRQRRQDGDGGEGEPCANDSRDRYSMPLCCFGSESGQGDGEDGSGSGSFGGSGSGRNTSNTIRGDGGGNTPETYEDYVAAALEKMVKAGAGSSALGHFERNVTHYQNRLGGHHSEVSSISTAPTDVDKVLRNLIVQCLVRNNREGGGGGVTRGSGCASGETDSRPPQPSTLGRDPSTSLLTFGADPSMVSPTLPRRRVGCLPGDDIICQQYPPMLSRVPSTTSSTRSSGGGGGRANSTRGAGSNGREDPPESGQQQPQIKRPQRRQPPRPDLVRYHPHGSSDESKIYADADGEQHTEQEKLSWSSDMLTRRGRHHKRILLEAMASSAAQSPPSPSSPMALPPPSASMASNSSVRNHPPEGVPPHRQHKQRPQQPRQRQLVPRPGICNKPNRFIPTTSILSAPSPTTPTNTDRLDNPDITQRRQMHQLRLQEQGGGVGAVSRVLTEQSEERRRRYKELLLRQKQQQLLLLQRQQQQQHHHQHPQHQQAAVNEKLSFSVAD